MVTRKKIGLLFVYDESWAGGWYYLLNIINALNYLPEAQKPELVIFYAKKEVKGKLLELRYPFLSFLPLKKKSSLMRRVLTKTIRTFFNKGYHYTPRYSKETVDFAFPCDYNARSYLGSLERIRIIYWIPDFQHKHLPHFFTPEEIGDRDKKISEIARMNVTLVLSSEDAKNDFVRYYSPHNVSISVMPFASILPAFDKITIDDLRVKYSIDTPYFVSPNQFWAHKNHKIILEAAALLKDKGYKYKILFTGKEQDYRNPDYATSLKQYVIQNGIENNISFLGFIDRSDQLQLMKHAIAVIQPSLFEGWSTVVEDTKAMSQTLILSNLNVHREQCGENAIYFDPKDRQQLAECIEKCLQRKISFPPNLYDEKILNYARQIINL